MQLTRTTLAGIVSLLILAAPAGATIVGPGLVTTAPKDSQTVDCGGVGHTTQSLAVEDVSATNGTVGGTSRIEANLTNPAAVATTQLVEIRLEGELLGRDAVRVPANATTRIVFDADLPPSAFSEPNSSDWRFVSVLTCEHGQEEWLYVDNGTANSASYPDRTANERKMNPKTPATSAP